MTRTFLLALVTATLAIPGVAQAQQLGGGAAPAISIVRILAALTVCIAAAFALALVIRARARGDGQRLKSFSVAGLLSTGFGVARRIEIIEVRRVSPHADVCLMRCDGTEYLLVCGSAGYEVLSRTLLPGAELEGVDGPAV